MMHKSILITGGTGSFGQAYVRNLVVKNKNIKRLVIFSRDELKQNLMSEEFSEKNIHLLDIF